MKKRKDITERILATGLQQKLVDNDFRYLFQMKALNFILGTVALVMSVMNFFTHKEVLMIATSAFSVICFINFLILLILKRVNAVSYAIFEISALFLFSYFILTGGTANFSPLWILLLPACGMLFLGRKRGFVIDLIMFLILVFFLWLPFGRNLLLTTYTNEFCMRFPVVYTAFFFVGYGFELIRSGTHNSLIEARQELSVIAETDTLTQLHNRYWFSNVFQKEYNGQVFDYDGLMILLDIDHFKKVNDTYGHQTGDTALKAVADILKAENAYQDALVCRWGGEEFFAYFPNCGTHTCMELCEHIRKKINENTITAESGENFCVSVSIGAVPIPRHTVINGDKFFALCDSKLYEAKETGRNKVVL